MTVLLITRCLVAVLTILRSQLVGSCSISVLNGTANCCTNYYSDGNVCKECPIGYHGINCTDMCPSKFYGKSCIQVCDCTPCHHIYGCNLTTVDTEVCPEVLSGTSCDDVCRTNTYDPGCRRKCKCSPCHYIYGCNTTSAKAEQTPSYEPKDGTESTYTQRRYVNTEQFIILFTGLLISAALIIAILWETYKYRKLKTPTTIKSSTNVNYEDIAV